MNELPCVDRLTIDGTSEKREIVIEPLDATASLKVRKHSPDGFEWGYSGSGPAQLALAILMDATGNHGNLATTHYQPFRAAHVSRWDDCWAITQDAIIAWLEQQAGIRA